jgi:hypothetical protein
MNGSVFAHSCRPAFLPVAAVCLLAWLTFSAGAAEPIIITSMSKQFVVRGEPQHSILAASARDDFAYLDPATLAVTCERVKQAVVREMGWKEPWHGIFYVSIHLMRFDNEPPDIIPIRTDRGWSYRINLPDRIARMQLLETLVEGLLLEFSHRAAHEEQIEFPPWLVEGLTAHLAEGPLAGIALQSRSLLQLNEEPRLRAARTTRHADVDRLLRTNLLAHGALTVDQLNWPEFDDNDQSAADAYHQSAHLFVRELLKMHGGPDALTGTLAMLPQYLNWQTAFLRGFESHFRRMLDVEKWWSLTLMQMRSHDSSALWSSAEAQQKLEEILYTPMEVRLKADEEAHVTPVGLQTVLNDWDFRQQSALLQTKIGQLQMLRLRCTPELAGLADGYRAALQKYLSARAHVRRWFAEQNARAAIASAIAELNTLDEQRAKFASQMLTAKSASLSGAP